MYFLIYLFPAIVAIGAIAGKVNEYRKTKKRKTDTVPGDAD